MPMGRSQHLRREDGRRQIRLHKFGVAVQMREDGQPRRRHQAGDRGVEITFLVAALAASMQAQRNAALLIDGG
jgi:hypothetical protein